MRQQNGLSRDADFIDYKAQLCTAGDQLPVTSGYVERDWVDVSLLREHGLQGAHPQFHFAEFTVLLVVVGVGAVLGHKWTLR